tara:strand:- start:1201 stop:2337 length:1137 start_codon:yes stop_codon:yes gene_type:complete
MKKLFLIIISTFLINTYAKSEIIELDKCIKKKFQQNQIYWSDLSKDIKDVIFSANFSTGILTFTKIFTPNTSYKHPSGKKATRETFSLEIETYTKREIIARSYYIDKPALRELMINPNDNTAIHRELIINLENGEVLEIINPGAEIVFDTIKYDFLSKKINEEKTFVWKCLNNENDNQDESGSSGTAFFVSNDGHLLTNNHVVEGCSISKITYLNKDYDTKLLATDKTLDLALLKAQLNPKTYFNFSKNGAKKLNKIYVAGYPLGKGLSDDLKISSGIVSSLKGFKDNSNEIQIDAPINPGNSGGPIINENGDLVAIAVSGLAKDQTEGINFGIKSSAAELFLKSNNIKPTKPMYSRIKDNDKLLKILEDATVYTYCD